MKKFFQDLEVLYHFNESDEDNNLFIIKGVFLKYLYDNEYIYKIKEILEGPFTINKIISQWAQEKIDCFKEEDKLLDEKCHDQLVEYIKNGQTFKGINSNIIGFIYEHISSEKSKKRKGMFYTPSSIVKHMIDILDVDFSEQHRVLDPACGSGFFLSAWYDEIFSTIKPHSKESVLSLHQFILTNQLYGMDKDPMAVLISKLVLYVKNPTYTPIHTIFCQDALVDHIAQSLQWSFDYIIGNPPYIGHKMLDKSVSSVLKKQYESVFYDKGDLSFCFFPLGMSLLKEKGQLIYISSRYFLESPSGRGLRKYISSNTSIHKIVDFNGNRLIKGAKVDLVIIHLSKFTSDKNFIEVCKLKEDLKVKGYNEIFQSKNYKGFFITQSNLLDDGWILIDKIEEDILNKIKAQTRVTLGDICNSFQGVITGCDKAFVFDEENKKKISAELFVPWIKNKNIQRYEITDSKKYLLYTDYIKDIKKYPKIEEYLKPFKKVLSKRRECKKGVREWYMLQWGRNAENFAQPKIIFPYKASSNRFAYDENHLFFSADIYAFVLKHNLFTEDISYEYLVCLLNSSLYEFYFKTFAKKLGGKLYDYYPNTVMRLKIPNPNARIRKKFKEYYDNIKYYTQTGEKEKVQKIMDEIDNELYEYFKLSDEEIKRVNSI